jgi:hypothetical protein
MLYEPLEITAGDHLTWTRYLSDYLPSAGWTLKYALRGSVAINIASTADGESHLVDVPGTTSKDYPAGTYSWAGYVEHTDGRRVTLYTGRMKINPDLVAQAAGYDGRSHAEKVLESIERVIEGRATRGDQELVFDGKRITKMTVAELIQLRQQYRNEVRAEQAKRNVKNGRKTGRIIKFRM